jgi:hypothetical protein
MYLTLTACLCLCLFAVPASGQQEADPDPPDNHSEMMGRPEIEVRVHGVKGRNEYLDSWETDAEAAEYIRRGLQRAGVRLRRSCEDVPGKISSPEWNCAWLNFDVERQRDYVKGYGAVVVSVRYEEIVRSTRDASEWFQTATLWEERQVLLVQLRDQMWQGASILQAIERLTDKFAAAYLQATLIKPRPRTPQ